VTHHTQPPWFPALGKGLATLGLVFTLVACGSATATEMSGNLIAPSPTATATIAPTATIPPTATLAPTPTATIAPTLAATPTIAKTPTRVLTPTAAATRAATTPTARPAISPTVPPAAGANTVRDEGERCQLTLIPGYTVDNAGDGFNADDENGLGVLSSAAGRSGTPEALAQSLYSGFTSVLTNVQQGKPTSNATTSQIDFTGTLASNSGKGTVYIKKFGTTVCGVSIFTYDKAQIPHEIATTSILLPVKENK